MRLKDRVAIVTGSSMGIGEAVALKFLENGARVVINSRDQGRSDEVAAKFAAIGYAQAVLPVAADVAKRDNCFRMVEQTLATWGRVDILVNNAGVNAIGPSEDLPEGDWQRREGSWCSTPRISCIRSLCLLPFRSGPSTRM